MDVRIGVLLAPLLVPLLLLAIWLARWSPWSQSPLERDPSRYGALLAGQRKAVGWRWAGLGAGVVVASLTAVTARAGLYNLGAMLSAPVFGLCVMGGVVAGELTTIPPRQGVRTAAFETRTVGEYLPRGLGSLVAASTLGLGALLVTTTLMGSADDAGLAGRFLSRQCRPEIWARNGPWPGSFYSVPLGIAVVVGLLGAAAALRTVVLRRRSVEAVVAATGVMVAASLSGVAFVAGIQLHRIACSPASWTVLGVALLAVGALMLLLTSWCLALLLAGRRFTPVDSGVTATAVQAVRR